MSTKSGGISTRATIAPLTSRAVTHGLATCVVLDVQSGEVDDDVVEPARPDGLGSLSPALGSVIDNIELDRELLATAMDGASKAPATPPAREICARLFENKRF